MNHFLSVYFIVLLSLSACFCSKKDVKPQAETENTKSISSTDSIFKLRISFISIGAGIDRSAVQHFHEFLKTFEVKHALKLNYTTINWGREGETDYCFKLSELNVSQQNDFVKETKEVLKNSSLVRYKENCICRGR